MPAKRSQPSVCISYAAADFSKGEFDIKYKKYNEKITKKHDISELFIGSFKKNKKEKEKMELSTNYLMENY